MHHSVDNNCRILLAARLPSIWRCLKVIGAAKTRPSLFVHGTHVPTVDIFICTCGEELSLLMDTVRAACNLDYPRNKFRVIILDDGNSPSCKKNIEGLRKERYSNIRYSARGELVKTHSKAANLNHGLDFVFKEGASEMVAVLDCDMIPERDWLRRLLPHVLRDHTVAIANIPQCFYDLPPHDAAGQLSTACHMCNVAATQQDFDDQAWCNGSGFVVRRKAIDQIGGFPTTCLLEDMLTSMALTSEGWKSVLISEPLQWGTVPDSFAGNVKQMKRWTSGSLTLSNALPGRNEPLGRAVALVESGLALSIGKSITCFFALPILLLSENALILDHDVHRLRTLLHLAFLDFAIHSAQGFLESSLADYCTSILQDYSQLWMSPYLAPDLIRWLFPWVANVFSCANFKPSGYAAGSEDSDTYRTSLLKRLKIMLWDNAALLHLKVLATCLTGVILSVVHTVYASNSKDVYQMSLNWLTHAGYPPAVLLWTSIICNSWIPMSYAIWNPHRPERESLLNRDSKTGVAYPTERAKDQGHRQSAEWQFKVMVVYYALATMGSWGL